MTAQISPVIKDLAVHKVILAFRGVVHGPENPFIPMQLCELMLALRDLDNLYDAPESEISAREEACAPINII